MERPDISKEKTFGSYLAKRRQYTEAQFLADIEAAMREESISETGLSQQQKESVASVSGSQVEIATTATNETPRDSTQDRERSRRLPGLVSALARARNPVNAASIWLTASQATDIINQGRPVMKNKIKERAARNKSAANVQYPDAWLNEPPLILGGKQ